MSKLFVRAARVRICDHRDGIAIAGSDGTVRRLEGDSAELARAILAFFSVPRDPDLLLPHLEELSGGTIEHPEVVRELLDLLLAIGVVRESAGAVRSERAAKSGARVVLGLTGAVATMHAAELIQKLQRRGHHVRVATTKNALRFITTDALTALTHEPVYTGLFDGPSVAPHIELAEWADAVVICPATATTIARIAGGDCSDLVAAIAVAARAPVLIAPSMNPSMLGAPSVERNLETLRDDGFYLVHPSMSVEVAHRPKERSLVLGGAADADSVVDLMEIVLASRAPSPSWDQVYRTTPPAQLPWYDDSIDADIARILQRDAKLGSMLLDVGAGLGSTAIGAARMGFRVVATDLSATALQLARERAPDLPITWLLDDITESRLETKFDVVLDRGCLNVLRPYEVEAYAASLARLTADSSLLIIKAHAAPYPAEEIARLFAGFDLQASDPTTIARTNTPALLSVLRRTAR